MSTTVKSSFKTPRGFCLELAKFAALLLLKSLIPKMDAAVYD